MAPAVFKTDVARYPGQAGSIPVRLRTCFAVRAPHPAFPLRKRSLLRVSYPRNAPMIYVFASDERPN